MVAPPAAKNQHVRPMRLSLLELLAALLYMVTHASQGSKSRARSHHDHLAQTETHICDRDTHIWDRHTHIWDRHTHMGQRHTCMGHRVLVWTRWHKETLTHMSTHAL
jgi:hypothetical protein